MVWVVLWVGFVALDADALTDVVIATVGTEFHLVDELLSLGASVSLIKTTASSRFPKVLATGSSILATATWLTRVGVVIPLVADWIFDFIVGTSVDWWDTHLLWTSASGNVFNELDGTAFHADWVWELNGGWAVFFTFAVEDLTAALLVNVLAIVKLFITLTSWSWVEFISEVSSTLVWVSLINANIVRLTLPHHAAIGPVENMVVLGGQVTAWASWAPGSFVETEGLFTISHVNVVSTQTVPSVVEIVSIISILLGITMLITVASLAHIPVVIPSPVVAKLVSIRTNGDLAYIWIFWVRVTSTLFWLLATAFINTISPVLEFTGLLLLTVHVVVPVVVVVL